MEILTVLYRAVFRSNQSIRPRESQTIPLYAITPITNQRLTTHERSGMFYEKRKGMNAP
jgi:hypothetical protein